MMNKNQTIRVAALSAITFLVGFVFINWFLSTQDLDNIPVYQWWTAANLMARITLVCTSLMPCKPILIAPVAIGSILLGVAFDALTDRTMDRNLFPIEMIIWAGISTPGIVAGSLTGCLVYWIKKKLHNNGVHSISESRASASSRNE